MQKTAKRKSVWYSKSAKVWQGNLEREITWNAALSSASCSWTKTVRLTSWYGIGRYTSALSYRGLQVSDSSFIGPFALPICAAIKLKWAVIKSKLGSVKN